MSPLCVKQVLYTQQLRPSGTEEMVVTHGLPVLWGASTHWHCLFIPGGKKVASNSPVQTDIFPVCTSGDSPSQAYPQDAEPVSWV